MFVQSLTEEWKLHEKRELEKLAKRQREQKQKIFLNFPIWFRRSNRQLSIFFFSGLKCREVRKLPCRQKKIETNWLLLIFWYFSSFVRASQKSWMFSVAVIFLFFGLNKCARFYERLINLKKNAFSEKRSKIYHPLKVLSKIGYFCRKEWKEDIKSSL